MQLDKTQRLIIPSVKAFVLVDGLCEIVECTLNLVEHVDVVSS